MARIYFIRIFFSLAARIARGALLCYLRNFFARHSRRSRRAPLEPTSNLGLPFFLKKKLHIRFLALPKTRQQIIESLVRHEPGHRQHHFRCTVAILAQAQSSGLVLNTISKIPESGYPDPENTGPDSEI